MSFSLEWNEVVEKHGEMCSRRLLAVAVPELSTVYLSGMELPGPILSPCGDERSFQSAVITFALMNTSFNSSMFPFTTLELSAVPQGPW